MSTVREVTHACQGLGELAPDAAARNCPSSRFSKTSCKRSIAASAFSNVGFLLPQPITASSPYFAGHRFDSATSTRRQPAANSRGGGPRLRGQLRNKNPATNANKHAAPRPPTLARQASLVESLSSTAFLSSRQNSVEVPGTKLIFPEETTEHRAADRSIHRARPAYSDLRPMRPMHRSGH